MFTSSLDAAAIETLRKIPKVEFHRHYDASIRFETIRDLAEKYQLDLSSLSTEELKKLTVIQSPMQGLQEVLDTFWATQKVLCHYDAIERVAFENVEDCYNDGVVLSELRFSPVFIGLNKSLSYEEIIEATLKGIDRGVQKYGIKVGLIFIAPRSLSRDDNDLAFDQFLKMKKNHSLGRYLIGFDLADREILEEIDSYLPWVNKARDSGLQITIHSGEDTGPEFVSKTLDVLGPTRIGHGIQSFRDSGLMKRLIKENIHLEVCPTSNYLTKCCPSLEEHPLPKLIEAGVSCSINSDDPHIMATTLLQEYKIAHELYQFGLDQLKEMNQNNLQYSFLCKKDIEEVSKFF